MSRKPPPASYDPLAHLPRVRRRERALARALGAVLSGLLLIISIAIGFFGSFADVGIGESHSAALWGVCLGGVALANLSVFAFVRAGEHLRPLQLLGLAINAALAFTGFTLENFASRAYPFYEIGSHLPYAWLLSLMAVCHFFDRRETPSDTPR